MRLCSGWKIPEITGAPPCIRALLAAPCHAQAGPLALSPKPDPDGDTSFSPLSSQAKLEVIKRKFTRKSRRVVEAGRKKEKALAWKQDAYWAPVGGWGRWPGGKAKHGKGPACQAQVSRPGPHMTGEAQLALWPAPTPPTAPRGSAQPCHLPDTSAVAAEPCPSLPETLHLPLYRAHPHWIGPRWGCPGT